VLIRELGAAAINYHREDFTLTGRHRRIALRVLLSRMRHDGCGGPAARAGLTTGIDGVSGLPVRQIVLGG
jgi:hypothetical protein